jgi:hypothetical protein
MMQCTRMTVLNPLTHTTYALTYIEIRSLHALVESADCSAFSLHVLPSGNSTQTTFVIDLVDLCKFLDTATRVSRDGIVPVLQYLHG